MRMSAIDAMLWGSAALCGLAVLAVLTRAVIG